jgi:DNA-directed RNA polymerase subunit M/transcription elongation factor TFIIS
VVNPYGFAMKIERDAALCGDCHSRGDVEQVDASDGFIQHHEQYEELFQSKHLVLDCVTCHNPHTLVVQQRQNDPPTTRTACENCHFKEKQYQAVSKHPGFKVSCIDCHMPRVTMSAEGNADIFTGDIRTHVMAIDPFQIGQFNEDGTVALSQISLDFACRHCHNPNGFANPKTDEELINAASGYHSVTTSEGDQ